MRSSTIVGALSAIGLACSGSPSISTGEQCVGTTTSLDVTVVIESCEPDEVICDATVTASGPGGAVTLTPRGATSDCSYIGDVSGGGEYTITVMAMGYPLTTDHLDVEEGCSNSTSVEVEM